MTPEEMLKRISELEADRDRLEEILAERVALLNELDPIVEKLQAENALLRRALTTLVERLDFVHADPRYQSVWTLFMIHGGEYTEPKYGNELEAARAALARSSEEVPHE